MGFGFGSSQGGVSLNAYALNSMFTFTLAEQYMYEVDRENRSELSRKSRSELVKQVYEPTVSGCEFITTGSLAVNSVFQSKSTYVMDESPSRRNVELSNVNFF